MVYQNIMVDIYQAASPAVGERLFDDDMLRDICYICEEIFQKKNKQIPYPQKEVEEYFEEFHTIISFFKHVEITLDFVDLDWSALLDELIHTFPQIAWIGGSKEKEDNRVVYYIDFVPIAYRDTGFPFMVNLLQSLDQQLLGDSDDLLESFIYEIERLVAKFIKPFKAATSAPIEKTEVVEYSDDNENYLLKMEEAVSRERYAKERMRLANKKLEVVIDQMERQNLSRAMKELSKTSDDDNENWDHILKVDLREYSQLLQKAKFLEQSWLMNKELVTKSEKMTISDNQLTYEREQVRSFKDAVSTNEIYLILDECKLIESRVKIKKKSWFRQPHVRIMKMDYDSILNKAAYFDLIQGENYLLEQIVLSEESIEVD
ncbi:hypothetical protein UAW_01968 [Enterococcus haemoperoxidus ATCC BAA-382]|uniref:Uncharacterized protein n=1 Tax=Enterococcus haemoperoxidus ATCC BAA-382 TaxID=1158608 RepID=R2T5U4_9ENTE|nr:hypothetical protein [Enterococcus haemoperoxidus]EOH95619.1 hypothetical protein UAW_01968 [Enterococcus haemoperoxidus ATCC BAA-382]EOT60298.1 hypothetical protein I583_02933 [Enterococcus haemoperoxidus ATCC BAA-382]OJG53294.1 hypothetical protein RV06_GL000698 [Enterococcus haemoperoxidus]